MSTTFGIQPSMSYPVAKLNQAAVGIQGPINIPPSASPAYIQAAEKVAEAVYAAFARHDIDGMMSYFSEDATWMTDLSNDFVKGAPFWMPLRGPKEIRRFFDENIPKYIKLDGFDIRGMSSGTCLNKSGIPCPRVTLTVDINAAILRSGKRYIETEYHNMDFDEKGNKCTNFQVMLNSLAALEAFSTVPEKEKETEKPSISQFQWVPPAVLERAKNNALMFITAWKNGEFEALNKFFSNEVCVDVNNSWFNLLPGDRGVMFQTARGVEEASKLVCAARNAQKILKYDIESLCAGAEWYTYNGHTKLLPTTLMIAQTSRQIIENGKRLDTTQLTELIWNEDGTKLIALNRRIDNAYTKKMLGK